MVNKIELGLHSSPCSSVVTPVLKIEDHSTNSEENGKNDDGLEEGVDTTKQEYLVNPDFTAGGADMLVEFQ